MGFLRLLNQITTGLFDGIFYPFRGHPWLGMVAVSLLTGLLMLFIFKLTSNQDAIRKTKNLLKARFLELWLFRNDFRSMLGATAGIVKANFGYVGHALIPLLFMIVPVVLILIQLDLRYGYRPLEAGESAILVARTDGSFALDELKLSVPEGVDVVSPALRIPSRQEVNWKVSPSREGTFRVILETASDRVEKLLVCEGSTTPVPIARARSAVDALRHPAELPLDAPFESVEIRYAAERMTLRGLRMHWLIPFFVLSILFGFALKGVFGVEV